MEDFRLVPQSDIDAIEQARLNIFKIVSNDDLPLFVNDVTGSMWRLTHKKYEAPNSDQHANIAIDTIYTLLNSGGVSVNTISRIQDLVADARHNRVAVVE